MSAYSISRRGFVFSSLAALLPFGAAKADDGAPAAPVPRSCVVWFSRTGHTRRVADAIRAVSGAKPFEIKLSDPTRYSDEYRKATKEVLAEIERGVKPEIEAQSVPVDDFDVFFIGTPTWWHHVAMPLQTWIKSQDFKGKLVLTCNTHGGGGLMHTREDFEKLLGNSGATLGTHLTVFGDVAEDDADVRQWLAENGLIGK